MASSKMGAKIENLAAAGQPRVFLAGTDEVYDVLYSLQAGLRRYGFHPVWFHSPSFPLTGTTNAMDACLEAVRTCDYFILVLDHRAGLFYDTHRTISEAEFDKAAEYKIPTSVFVRVKTWHQSSIYHHLKGTHRVVEDATCKALGFHAEQPVLEFLERLMHRKVEGQPEIPWITAFTDADEILEHIRGKWCPYNRDQIYARYSSSFYWYGSNWAASIRLVGAADECFTPGTIQILPSTEPYDLPTPWQASRQSIIEHLQREAEKGGHVFQDGPVMRLIRSTATVVPPEEQKHLKLHLGPLGWHDFSVACYLFEDFLSRGNDISRFVDLDQIVSTGDVTYSSLSNILDTATTIVTTDGCAMYSRRGGRQSVARDLLTSAIAENIHPDKDGALTGQREGELPSIFKTVIRGIGEEASPALAEIVRAEPGRLLMLGLGFNLDPFHPDALFMVHLPLKLEEVLRICTAHPGKDFWEGKMGGVQILDARSELENLLSDVHWVPGGKASLIRTVEYLDSVANARQCDVRSLCANLRPA